MARLQILKLPTEHHGDDMTTPYLLVIDQVDDNTADDITRWPDDIAKRTGARHVLCFTETVDIPANETALPTEPEPRIIDFADLTEAKQLTAARDEARTWARHGYEIGQRHCGWTDHGVAPAWLTDGWPPHIDSCEHLKHAADLEETEAVSKRVAKEQRAALADALGMDHTRDWDDIRNAARGIRKERDAQAAALDRVHAESARIRTITRTWEPVADLIDAALNGQPEQP